VTPHRPNRSGVSDMTHYLKAGTCVVLLHADEAKCRKDYRLTRPVDVTPGTDKASKKPGMLICDRGDGWRIVYRKSDARPQPVCFASLHFSA